MLDQTQEKPVKIIRLSHSRLNSFLTCPQAFNYRYMYKNPDWVQDGFAAGIGTAFHVFVQEYLSTKDFNKSLYQALCAYPFHLYEQTVWGVKKDYGKTWQMLVRSCEHFRDLNMQERYEIVQVKGKPAVETTFEVELGVISGKETDYKFVYEGHIDLILLDNYSHSIYPVDIKTFTDPDMAIKYEFSDQLVMYSIVVAHMRGLIVSDGHIKMQEEYDSKYWLAKLSVLDPSFDEKQSIKDETVQTRFFSNLLDSCKRMANYAEMNWWATNRESCYSWKSRCKFANMCGTTASEAEKQDWILGNKEPRAESKIDFQFKINILN